MNIGFSTARVLAILACLVRLSSIASVAQTVTFSPTSLSFGNQVQGTTSAVRRITLTNNQVALLHITSIAAHVADYVATSTCPMGLAALSPGASCKISVTFTPSLLGPRTDTLSVTDDGRGSPQTIPLSGSGVTAVSVSPTTVSFKNQVVGTTSAATTVTLKNNQTGPVTIGAITTNASDYSRTTSCPSTLNGGLTCTISVTFKPVLTGARSGVLSVSDNSNFNPTVSLSGTGISAVVLNPTGLSFGNQAVGTTSAVQAITVKNNQPVGLAISSIATSVSDFIPTSNCPSSPSTLPANTSCTVNVAFTPKAIGARAGTLRVTDNANNNPQTASLAGTGLATLVSIAVNPLSASIPLGKTQQFTAVGTYSDGSTQNLISSVAWSSSAAAISTVSGAGVATSVSPGTTNIIAKSGTITGSGSLQVGPPALASLSVNPSSTAVPLGSTQQFTATGTYTDASTQNLTSSINWSSSSPSVAGVSSSGLATAATTGSATITAASGAITASANLSVVQPVVVSLAITPSNPSFALGTTKQLKATGTYSDGSTLDLTTSAKWSSALSSIATVDGQGLATSVSQGSVSVTATAGSTSGSTTLSVTPAALVSIAITPAIPQIPLGTTQQFTATGTFTDGSNQNITNTVAWSSDTTGVATTSNDQSSPGLATSLSKGSAKITATSGSVTGTTTLTVTAAMLASIAVTPADPSIALGTIQQFTATGTFTDGSMQDLTGTVAWSSNTTSTASIDAKGLATSAGTGTSTVSASSGTVTGSTVLTVTAATLVSIAINPQTVAVPLGGAPQFTAIGTYSDGTTQNLTQLGHWSSTDASVATISNSPGTQGLALTLSTGTTTIAIASASVSASATMTVSPSTLVSIAVTPANESIALGAQQQFSATGTFTDSSTQDLTSTATWSSDTTSTASIDAKGLATSAGTGTSTVSASSGTVTGSTVLTVTAAALVSIAINPQTVAVPLGVAQQFIATVTGSSNQNVSWTVDGVANGNSTIGTISATGLYTAPPMIGSHSIAAIAQSSSSIQATATVTVGSSGPVPNTFFGMHLNNIADPIPASMQGSARIWDSAGAQWPSVNTASGIFNWNKLDTLLADYKVAGIDDVLYTLWRVPQWASSNPTDTNCDYLAGGFTGGCDPPTDLNADGTGSNLIWRTWVQNISQHVNDPIYLQNHARVKYWDPCNECYRSPTLNVGYGATNYSYRGTYAQLVRMMQDARCIIVGNPDDAITALNATCGQAGYPVIGVDPTAQMVMPDTAPGRAGTKQNPYAQVMQNILYCTCANNSCSASSAGCPTGAGGSGAVDIIASHLYADTYTPEQLPTQAALVRSYLSKSDLQKPFWSIEGGWGRNTALQVQSDPDLEAAFVARYNLMVWASGTTRAYWYGWDYTVFGTLWGTAATNGCSTRYANGYVCTPGIAYQQIHDWLLGAVLTACSVVGTTWDCRLTESTGAPADIVWDTSQSCSSGSCGTIQHSVAPEYIKYRDLTGTTSAVYGSMVPVGIKPILLETQ